MNYCSYVSLLLSSCIKSDANVKYKIISRLIQYKKTSVKNFSKSAVSRMFQSPPRNEQNIEKEGITALPSPQEVTYILQKNEFNRDLTSGSAKSYDCNQLASNHPIEDTRSEALCKMTPGLLLGVFDGHGGPACAQVISKRLLTYVAAALLPPDILKTYVKSQPREELLETFNDRVDFVEDIKEIYQKSFNRYLGYLLEACDSEPDVKTSFEKAFSVLDDDLSREVIESYNEIGQTNSKLLSVALSGAVACVAHIDGPHLYVANVGDCNAVIGTQVEDDAWTANKLTKEHNSENYDELKRVWSEHPESERRTVIRRDRLLGELAPLRSMGDFRYKWPVETLTKVAVPVMGQRTIPAHYHTPPYLSAKPDVFYHRLTPNDKFLIIASDGLWDMMTPLQSVQLVGEHMKGKVFFNPLKLPQKNIQLGDLNQLLSHRKESLKSKPKDRNAATHLLRHAIGGTEYGIDHSKLAHLLTLSPDVSRMFRDDMTVTVVYFDSEYLTQCPS